MDNIPLDQIEAKIQVILRQTDYTEDKAREKLIELKYNELAVIRQFMGVPEKKQTPIKSVNQAIYKQIRTHLDGAMSDYRERVDKGEAKNIV